MGVMRPDYWFCEWVGCARVRKGSKRACTVASKTGPFPPPPLQPVSTANRLSLLSKRWTYEVEGLRLTAMNT